MNSKFHFTSKGLKELRGELEELVKNKRPRLIDRVAVARNHGDLSENSEYTAAREDLAFVEGRIDEIEGIVSKAVLIKENKTRDMIGLGSKVQVKVGESVHVYELVGEWEADPLKKKISDTSPLGKALLGKKKGDKIEVEAPAGKVQYHIEDIS